MSPRLELIAGPDEDGVRLDVALGHRAEVGSRSAAERLVEAGLVTVDGRRLPRRHRLRAGERVLVADPERQPPAGAPGAHATDVRFDVTYEDEHLLVVDKPAGLVVHPAPGHRGGTLAQALADRGARGGASWRPGIVHRLDRDTSGLLVVAKSEPVHRSLQELLRARRMEREYIALVDGRPASRSGTIDAPIGRDRARRTIVSTRTDRPRAARTHFRIVEELPRATLVEVRLETGRTHQIRAHFSAIEHPVLGDVEYGGEAHGRLGLVRQFLHARRLAFPHPITAASIECESPLPDDLRRALAAAREEA